MTTFRSAAAAHPHARDHAIAAVTPTGTIPDTAGVGIALAGPIGARATPAQGATALVGQTGANAVIRTHTRNRLIYPRKTPAKAILLRRLQNPTLTLHRSRRLSHRHSPKTRMRPRHQLLRPLHPEPMILSLLLHLPPHLDPWLHLNTRLTPRLHSHPLMLIRWKKENYLLPLSPWTKNALRTTLLTQQRRKDPRKPTTHTLRRVILIWDWIPAQSPTA